MPLLLDKFTGFSYINDYNHDFFPNNHKVLVIPSGELMGDEDSEIIKNAIRLFAESGGTVVALAQQYGEHFDKLLTNYSTTNLFLIVSVVVDYNSLC